MEKTSFSMFIQQKNKDYDLKKITFQGISTMSHQKVERNIFQIDNFSFNNQRPAFLNRKVKHLKFYTNHFKRSNIQTYKTPDLREKTFQNKKTTDNKAQKCKIQNQKNQLSKQLGLEDQIKSSDTSCKIPEISVYQQFLQKTNSTFSNIIQNINQHGIFKKKTNNQNQTYQKQCKAANAQRFTMSQQRRPLGPGFKQVNLKLSQAQESNKQKNGIKSMNQLARSQQVFVKSQKICIMPNIVPKQEKKHLSCALTKRPIPQIMINTDLTQPSSKSQTLKFSKTAYNFQIKNKKTPRKVSKQVINTDRNGSISNWMRNQGTNIQTNVRTLQHKDIDEQSSRCRLEDDCFQGQNNLNNVDTDVREKDQRQAGIRIPLNKVLKQQVMTNNVSNKPSLASQTPAPSKITAFSYIIYEPSFSQNPLLAVRNLNSAHKIFNNSRILTSLNCKAAVQIASLTKIMTFLVVLQICEKLNLNFTQEKVRIGKFESNINGTSADIKQGEIYTVDQLFHGLMLPSGNDVSLALTSWAGKKMLIAEIRQKQNNRKKILSQSFQSKILIQPQSNDIASKERNKISLKKKKCYERFILQMNKKARFLGMTKTTYANSHGLSNVLNKSCAFDLCILCQYAMLNQKFRKVVSTKQFKCKIQFQQLQQNFCQKKQQIHFKGYDQQENQNNYLNIDDIEHENQHSDEQSMQQFSTSSLQNQHQLLNQKDKITKFQSQEQSQCKDKNIRYGEREVRWQNTHKLLQKEEYIGIKTGITSTAGPCLASCIRTKQNRCFIIIVLDCKKLSYRFKDTELLKKWLLKKQKIATLGKSEIISPKQDIQEVTTQQIEEANKEPKEQ